MLDRLLVLAESSELPAVVVVNKIDLADRAETEERFSAYRAAGYDVLLTSAQTGEGVSVGDASVDPGAAITTELHVEEGSRAGGCWPIESRERVGFAFLAPP